MAIPDRLHELVAGIRVVDGNVTESNQMSADMLYELPWSDKKYLVNYLDDQRPSFTLKAILGPFTIGDFCHECLVDHLVETKGVARDLTKRPDFIATKDALREWMGIHAEADIAEMRIKVLQHQVEYLQRTGHSDAEIIRLKSLQIKMLEQQQ